MKLSSRGLKRIKFFAVILMVAMSHCFVLTAEVEAGEVNLGQLNQRFLVAVPMVQLNKDTLTRSEQHVFFPGLGGEYAIFLGNSIALGGQFHLSQNSEVEGIPLIGAGANLLWFAVGGANYSHQDVYVKSVGVPRFSIFTGGGLGMLAYSLLELETITREVGDQVELRDAKDSAEGAVFGFNILLGAEYHINKSISSGLRVQSFTSLSDDSQPDLTALSFWASLTFNL